VHDRGQDSGQKNPQPCEDASQVVSDGGEDGIGGVSGTTFEIAATEVTFSQEISEARKASRRLLCDQIAALTIGDPDRTAKAHRPPTTAKRMVAPSPHYARRNFPDNRGQGGFTQRPRFNGGMSALTRRRDPDALQETWLVYLVYQAWRDQRDWTARKYAMWNRREPFPSQQPRAP
jgi:hypothetical protein